MKEFKNFPRVLLQKVILTALIGIACFIIGGAYYIFTKDSIMLYLSIAVLCFSGIRTVSLYYLISKQKYETVEGTCVGIGAKPLKKYYTVKIMDDAGTESSLRLGKQTKIKIGFRYRFYFKKSERISAGSEYFDTVLSSDQFLGFEELGEFMEQNKEPKTLKSNDKKEVES